MKPSLLHFTILTCLLLLALTLPTPTHAQSTIINLDLTQATQNNGVVERSLFFASPDRPDRLGPEGIGSFTNNASITLPFSITEAGNYRVVITYGLLERKVPFTVKIDGSSPSSWQNVTLWPSTVNYTHGSSRKLYGHDNDHLKTWTLSTDAKALSAGNHTITLEFPEYNDPKFWGFVITNVEVTSNTTPTNSSTPWLFDKYVEFPGLKITGRTISGSNDQPTITLTGTLTNLEPHQTTFSLETSVMSRIGNDSTIFTVDSVNPSGTFSLTPGESSSFNLTARATGPIPNPEYSELVRVDLESVDVPNLSRPYFLATGINYITTNPDADIYFKGKDAREWAVQSGTDPQYVIPNRNSFNFVNGEPVNTVHEAFIQALANAPDSNPTLSVPDNGGYVFNYTEWARAGAPSQWHRTHPTDGTSQAVSFDHNGEASFGRRHMLTKIFDGTWQHDLTQAKSLIMFLAEEMPYYNPYGRWDAMPGYLPIRQYEYGGTVTLSGYVKLLQAGLISDEEHFKVLLNVILPLYAVYRDDLRQFGTITEAINVGDSSMTIDRAVPEEMYMTDFLPSGGINHWFKIGTGDSASYVRRGYNTSTNKIGLETNPPGVLDKDFPAGTPWTAYRMREWLELEATDIWSFLALGVASQDPAVYEAAAERIEVHFKTQNIFREDGSFGNEPGSYGWAAYLYINAYNQVKSFLGEGINLPESLDTQMLNALIMWLDFPYSNGYHPMLNGGGAVNQLHRGRSPTSDPAPLYHLKQTFPELTDLIAKYENIISQEQNRTPGSMVDNTSFKVDWWGYAMLRGPGSWDQNMETLLSSKKLKFNPGDHVSNDALGLAIYAHGSIMTPRYGYDWIGYPALLLNRVSIDRTNPGIWGDFYHFDGHQEVPSVIAYTDMAGSHSTTPGLAHQERWNVQLPEYLFDAYFVRPFDGATHRFEWGFRNMGEVDIVNPNVTLAPATEPDGSPWEPFGYYRENTGHEGMGFSTNESWQAEWTMNEGSIIHSPSSDPSDPNEPNNYPLPGSKMRLTMAAQPNTKVVTAWLTGPGRNDRVRLRQDFVAVERTGTEAVFIDAIEPIYNDPFVQSIEETAVNPDGSRAVKITTTSGNDWFLVGNNDYTTSPSQRTIGPFTTDAKLAMIRIENGQVTRAMFNEGTNLEFNDGTTTASYTHSGSEPFHYPATTDNSGDYTNDGLINLDDFWEVITNFIQDSYSIFDFNQVITHFGS